MGILSNKVELALGVLVLSKLFGKDALYVYVWLSELKGNGTFVKYTTLLKEGRVIKRVGIERQGDGTDG